MKRNYLLLAIAIPLIIILFIISYNIISYRISLINKWNKIESSYEIANKIDLSEEEKNAIYDI